tara:strand:- start:1407 stop:1736 length:330 start_codon:yes stop_codon:yes gene_type:complete
MGIFDDDNYNADRYGVPTRAGTPDDWKAAYEDRMGRDQYEEVLGSTKTAQSREQEAIAILEITETTIVEGVIKRSYRKLAMKVHPDHGGTQEAFERVQAAYSLLMDLYG